MQWLEEYRQLINVDALAVVLQDVGISVGKSSDRRLSCEHIRYVTPLKGHYRLPTKVGSRHAYEPNIPHQWPHRTP